MSRVRESVRFKKNSISEIVKVDISATWSHNGILEVRKFLSGRSLIIGEDTCKLFSRFLHLTDMSNSESPVRFLEDAAFRLHDASSANKTGLMTIHSSWPFINGSETIVMFPAVEDIEHFGKQCGGNFVV